MNALKQNPIGLGTLATLFAIIAFLFGINKNVDSNCDALTEVNAHIRTTLETAALSADSAAERKALQARVEDFTTPDC